MNEVLISQGIVALVIAGAVLVAGFALIALYVMIGNPK